MVGTFLVTKHFLPQLSRKQTKVVVNLTSGCGSISANAAGRFKGLMLPYNSSKAAVNMRKAISKAYCSMMFWKMQPCLPCIYYRQIKLNVKRQAACNLYASPHMQRCFSHKCQCHQHLEYCWLPANCVHLHLMLRPQSAAKMPCNTICTMF